MTGSVLDTPEVLLCVKTFCSSVRKTVQCSLDITALGVHDVWKWKVNAGVSLIWLCFMEVNTWAR